MTSDVDHLHLWISSRGFDWRIHCSIEVTELSTNKQHTLTLRKAEKVMIQAFRNWQLLNQGSAMEDSIARPTLLGLKRDRGGREVRIMTSERARSIL